MRRTIGLLCLLILVASPAQAQLKGHYIPGFTGLDDGTQPPPGITLAFPVYAYPTDTIKMAFIKQFTRFEDAYIYHDGYST